MDSSAKHGFQVVDDRGFLALRIGCVNTDKVNQDIDRLVANRIPVNQRAALCHCQKRLQQVENASGARIEAYS